MRRFWIVLLAIAMALVIALPAGAGKPVKPPTSVSIAVSMDAWPLWLHEGSDLIGYAVTLENKTSNDISDVAVMFTTTDPNVYQGPISDWDSTEGHDNGLVPANSSVWMNFYLRVDQFLEADPCLTEYDPEEPEAWPDECALLATAKVLVGNDVIAQTQMSMPLMPDPPCGFVNGEATLTGGEVCIWKPPSSGEWTVSVKPTKTVTRPTRMMVSVRDGVPGNWCTVPDGVDTGVVIRRLMPGDTAFELQVLLPGSDGQTLDGLADGQCNSGGAGGNYFAVGNPESFYLYTSFDGTATIWQP